MIIRLPSGLRIAVSPFFFWESRRDGELLRVRSGSAFHPYHITTRMCLELLEDASTRGPYRSVLDVGCGSGVLALAAVRMGAAVAVGCDIDLRAVRVARENAAANALLGRSYWLKGTTDAIRGPFDCVVANLPVGVLRPLAPDLAELTAPHGVLIVSGFQDLDWRALEGSLTALGLEIIELRSGDFSFYDAPPSGSFTWMAVCCRKAGESSRW